jgi:hypothetical protein
MLKVERVRIPVSAQKHWQFIYVLYQKHRADAARIQIETLPTYLRYIVAENPCAMIVRYTAISMNRAHPE